MTKFFNYFNIKILILLIFLNYLIYFSFDTKFFFIFFSYSILLTFIFILIKNIKINFYIVLIIIFLSLISLGSPVSDWDSRSIWLFNAKRIFLTFHLKNSHLAMVQNFSCRLLYLYKLFLLL